MAKMFYSLQEAAQRLRVSEDDVRNMVETGQLQEFRDEDELVFKVEQVELLAEGNEDVQIGDSAMGLDASDEIKLADTGTGSALGLADSSPLDLSGIGDADTDTDDNSGSDQIQLDDVPLETAPKERSGISIFDADDMDTADPSAVTRITDATEIGDMTLENAGSGSGLLDLTREGDDTSLGADLMLDDGLGEDNQFSSGDSDSGADLFEPTAAPSDVSPGAAQGMVVAAAHEPYSGTWSGIAGGMMLATSAFLLAAIGAMIISIVGGPNVIIELATSLPDPTVLILAGAMLGVIVFFALVGMLLGKRTD